MGGEDARCGRGEGLRCYRGRRAVLGDEDFVWRDVPCCALHNALCEGACRVRGVVARTITLPNVPSPSTLWIS